MSAPRTFNTPLESGLRSLFILSAAPRRSFDSQRLVYFDYILVHSADLGGEESLHPRTPSRKGELLVRRRLVQQGLALLRSRELAERRFLASGIAYRSTKAGRHVASLFESEHSRRVSERAAWVVESFGELSDKQLVEVLERHIGNWEEEMVEDLQPRGSEDFHV